MPSRQFWLGLAALVVESPAWPASAAAAAAPLAPLVVQTAQGAIEGSIEGGTRRFAGVRYAAAPVGALRWSPPQLPAAHAGTVAATAFGSQCPQADGNAKGPNEDGDLDCLFLNIHTPLESGARLPVMMFIHGGSFVTGAGSLYPPYSLVRQGNVIVVTINYRLGLEGSLALSELDVEQPVLKSGAYGLLDQQAALQWLRANIANFGGDPDNITLFGESAGASAVCNIVASPLATGTFTAAIAESGCNLVGAALPDAEALGLALAQRVGCAPNSTVDLECLRAQTPQAITEAAMAVGAPAAQTYGGGVLPMPPLTAFPVGSVARVPLMLGSNSNEGRLFVYAGTFGIPPLTTGMYRKDLRQNVTPITGLSEDRIYAVYPSSNYASPIEAYSAVIGDAFFSCPTLLSDGSAVSYTTVFGYEFSDPNASLLGATHATELPYLFDEGMNFSADQQALSTQMIGYWTNFAHGHDPNGAGLPRWPAFSKIQNLAPLKVGPLKAQSFYDAHHCGFWATAPTLHGAL